MSCEPWMEAISARADGEPATIDDRLLDAHLASCARCRAFAEDIHRVGRVASLQQAATMPDLAGHVIRAARSADRKSVWWVLRLGLGVVAIQVIILSTPALLLGHAAGSDEHNARHLGSFAIAYAIGLLVVSLRPAKARGMLPLAAALAGCLAITAVIDIFDGRTPVIAEVRHVPEVIGLVLVWLLAKPKRLPRDVGHGGLPRLTAVRDAAGHESEGMRESS
ncbi:MAG: zf-HC2 domain-containing protein [Ilumatobacteraceae bacterium]